MKIINAVGPRLPGLVIGLAKQKAAVLQRSVKLRPYKKFLAYTTDTTQDQYVIIIQLFQNPALDRILIVNVNEFRIVNAINEVLGDGSYHPTVYWKGGIPPFIVELQHRNPVGDFLDSNTTGLVVNINPSLTDGVGDIVTAGSLREYIITKLVDTQGWWADDLVAPLQQDAIGLSITDSSVPPRIIFAPFTPESPTSYTHFGPPTWAVPPVVWNKMGDGVRYPYWLFTDGIGHVPGAGSTVLPGTFTHFADGGAYAGNVPVPAGIHAMRSVFAASDLVHYHEAEDTYSVTIAPGIQYFTITSQRIYSVRSDYSPYTYVGDIFQLAIDGNNSNTVKNGPSGNPITAAPVGGTMNVYQLTINASGLVTVTFSVDGDSNYEEYSFTYQRPDVIQALYAVITFGTIPALTVDGTFTIPVSSTSPQSITFILQGDVNHNGDITSNGQLTPRHAGASNLTIRAQQAGNQNYFSASQDIVVSIGKGTAYVVWNNSLGAITYGTNLVGKLNAVAYRANGVAFTGAEGAWAYYEINHLSEAIIQQVTEATVLEVLPGGPTGVPTGRVLKAVFTPYNTDDYLASTSSATGDNTNQIIINKADQIIAFVIGNTNIYPGQQTVCSLTAYNAQSGNLLTYSSGNNGVATVTTGGAITGQGVGNVYIALVQAGSANYNQGSFSVYLNVHTAVSFWTASIDDCPGVALPAGFIPNNLAGPSGGNYNTGNAVLVAYTGSYPNRIRWTFIWDDGFCDSPGLGIEYNGYDNFVFSTHQCDGTAVDYSLAQIEAVGGYGGIPGSPGIPRSLFATTTGIIETEYCRNLNRLARYFLVRKEQESLA